MHAETARRLHVTQASVADLMRGKIDQFSIDTLVNMLTAVGLRVEARIVQMDSALDEGYRAMVSDTLHEAEAMEWTSGRAKTIAAMQGAIETAR